MKWTDLSLQVLPEPEVEAQVLTPVREILGPPGRAQTSANHGT